MKQKTIGASSHRPNIMAVCVTVLGIGLLYSSFDPVPAGENTAALGSDRVSQSGIEFELPPMPPEAQQIAASEDSGEPSSGSENNEQAVAVSQPQIGCVLNDQETIKFALLLLKDGARYLKGIDNYTAAFHKEERVNGDMTEAQTIDLKIQHAPHFAVYMKWRNGDKGRQVLYSDEYEDGNMVVKLGGLKGRFLPAIKLNPLGSQAMSESRHPITEAGVLGMVKKMINHREMDLKHGHGVRCTRMPNQEFDQRDCYCFVFEYESPEFSEVYRKSVMLLDARHHIPLLARNYTWAADPEGMSAEELDQLTLIENYSFTELDFAREMVAQDFSRDNPRYRM